MRLLALPALALLAPISAPDDSAPSQLSSGDDYTVLGALAELPASTATDSVLVQTGDLVAATILLGAERPTEPDFDAVRPWANALTGVPFEDGEFADVFVPLADVFNFQFLQDIGEFDAALGWSLVDVDAFVEQSSPPDSFAVITGDFDETTLNPDLPEVADGVVTYGDGEDFETNPSDPNPVDRLGRSLRLAQDGDRIAASLSTPFAEEWLAGPEETLADDESLTAVAAALDDADVVGAVITRVEGGIGQLFGDRPISSEQIAAIEEQIADQVPAAPFDVVGIGWSVVEGEAAITVAYHFASSGEAADAVGSLQNLYREGTSLATNRPLTDLLTLEDVAADENVVSVSLTVSDEGRPQVIYEMLQRNDLPFLSR